VRKKTAERLARSKELRAAKQPRRLRLEPALDDGATLRGLDCGKVTLSFGDWIDLLNYGKEIRLYLAARLADKRTDMRREIEPYAKRRRGGGSFSAE
jgi:hypothetical protein